MAFFKPRQDVTGDRAESPVDLEYRSVLECVPALIWYKDVSNTVLRCSGRVAKTLDRSIEEVEGCKIHDLYPDESDRYFADDLEVIRTGRPKRGIIEPLLTASGEKIWVRTDKTPHRDATGRITGVVVASVELAPSEDPRGTALAAELERERRRVASRDELLTMTAHELRTPLTPISLKIEMIERLVDDVAHGRRSQEQVRQAVHSLSGHVEFMARRIDDLIDATRLSQGTLKLERVAVNLGTLVRDVVERFSEVAAKAGSSMSLSEEANVVGYWDPARLEQVVINLLTNAVKYGRGQPVAIRVRQVDKTALFSVRDAGIGISNQDQQRIFRKFERTDSASSFAGLGLGLFITRQIVEAHGGRVFVASDEGCGAEFFVELPLDA